MCRQQLIPAPSFGRQYVYGGQLWNTSYTISGLTLHLQISEANCDSSESIYHALSRCQVVVLTYDTSNRSSFESLSSKWAAFLSARSIPTIVVGLKPDLSPQVNVDEVEELCNKYKFCSARRLSMFDGPAAAQEIMDAVVFFGISK